MQSLEPVTGSASDNGVQNNGAKARIGQVLPFVNDRSRASPGSAHPAVD